MPASSHSFSKLGFSETIGLGVNGQEHPAAGRYVRFGTCHALKRPVGTVATVADTVAGAGLDRVVWIGRDEP